MTAIGRALMARPKMILLDEPSMGLAPQLIEEIFEIVRQLNRDERVSFLLAEQNTNIALRYADYGYILENGRVVMDGEAASLAENEDVKELYLGFSSGGRRSFRDLKSAPRAACSRAGSGAATWWPTALLITSPRRARCWNRVRSHWVAPCCPRESGRPKCRSRRSAASA